jgi:hypothetical protein
MAVNFNLFSSLVLLDFTESNFEQLFSATDDGFLLL